MDRLLCAAFDKDLIVILALARSASIEVDGLAHEARNAAAELEQARALLVAD